MPAIRQMLEEFILKSFCTKFLFIFSVRLYCKTSGKCKWRFIITTLYVCIFSREIEVIEDSCVCRDFINGSMILARRLMSYWRRKLYESVTRKDLRNTPQAKSPSFSHIFLKTVTLPLKIKLILKISHSIYIYMYDIKFCYFAPFGWKRSFTFLKTILSLMLTLIKVI